MTFNPLAGSMVIDLLDQLPEHPSVVELGNQRFTVSDEVLREKIQEFRSSTRNVDTDRLSSFVGKSTLEKYPLTESFYLALGFKSYTAIDINTKYGSRIMDLNRDLRRDYAYTETFDLVTNNGTGEHIFNQYAVLKNVHHLANLGGIMLHILPFVNWVNHGFFNFHPILFADLAAANGYKIVKLSIVNRWGFEIRVNLTDQSSEVNASPIDSIFSKAMKSVMRSVKASKAIRSVKAMLTPRSINREIPLSEALSVIRPRRGLRLTEALERVIAHQRSKTKSDFPNVLIVAALKKVRSQPFVAPMQGKYLEDLEGSEIAAPYEGQPR